MTSPLDIPYCKKIINETLLKNDFPSGLIKKLYNEELEKVQQLETSPNPNPHSTDQIVPTERDRPRYCAFYNIEGITNKISTVAKKMNVKTKFGLKPAKCVGNFFTRVKDRISDDEKCDVIYATDCLDCPRKYIGQTRRSLKQRKEDHQKTHEKLQDLLNNPVANQTEIQKCLNTAMMHHVYHTGHSFDIPGTKILGQDPNRYKLNFLEMAMIKLHETVNFRTDVQNISSVYAGILHNLRQQNVRR